MKKSIRSTLIRLAIPVVLGMVLSLSACGSNETHTGTNSFYVQGLEVVQLMSEMTNTDEYIALYTGSGEIKTVVQQLGSGDYRTPKAVYAISMTDDNLAAMAQLRTLDTASEELKDFLAKRVLGSLMTRINGMSGVENLAAASVCTVGKTFVNKQADGHVIYLYTYDNATPVAVTFTVGEDQTVSATGVFMLYDGLACGSADELKSFFSGIDGDATAITVDVAEVTPNT